MEVSQTINLYITYVEKEGPFLKVWGQTDKNNSVYVEQFLLGASPQFDLGVGKVLIENLQVGTLVCTKYKDNKYYRARITNIAYLQEGFVEVSFLDYGNKDVVPCGNIRSLQNFPSSFISVPPLATGFIFAEAHCPGGGEWNDTIFDNISKEIKYLEVQCTLLIQATQYFLIKIFIGGNDLCGILITRGLMQPISLQAQQAVLLSMSMQQRQSMPLSHAVPPPAGINTYKACTLEPGCQYPVYVSYVNDGPCHFSVQLKQSEEVLAMLMNDINTITLRLLEDIPIPGTICLARCQEDGNICRAVVTNEVDNQFKVFYVDFGNYEVVPLDALYHIPFKYVLPKVMAIRFSLTGVEKSTVTLEMQCAFKQFVDNRLLHMKVLPTPTRTAIPKCELWDPETKTSALDVVNRAARHAYPEPITLNRGFSQPVKVSYVYSCNRFYVQLANKENELLKLMLDLQATCQTNDTIDPTSVKVGLPCCALFESDHQWYRSQVVESLGNNVKVRYIDYGNEEMVPVSQLKIIDGEQLTVLRPQAIECCLNGYQNMTEDIQRDEILEELLLEESFTMKVIEMINKKALVELFDSSNYNVSSLLLDKLAAAKSQVSPMLVQAGNKIEHRKSFSHQNGPKDQNFRQDRKPGREYKNYDRTNDRNEKTWRQDNKDYRHYEKQSNEHVNEKGSWRDNNKGFSPNSDRYGNRDRSRNRNERYTKSTFTVNTERGETSDANEKRPASSDDWETPSTNVPSNSRVNNFQSKGTFSNRFDSDKENWNSGKQRGEFKKRNDFRKDGSEVSSSGSEKSFHKGPRTSSRNDRFDRPKFEKKFDKPRNAPFNNSITNDSWNVSSVSPSIDAAPITASFTPYDVVGTEARVVISWFHNPGHFYCQLVDFQKQFKSLMDEIQQFYKTRKPDISVVGAPIVGLFPEDNVLYRAQVLEVIGSQYKVYYVDFGNVSTINKVWPIDKKFMNLPAQAIICSLSGIGPPVDGWPDADNYSHYFNKDAFICRFVNKDEEKTFVDLFYDDKDTAQLLVEDGLATSTQNSIPDIEIPLLLGQQFRATVKSINNLNDIIIALECGLALSCKMNNLETATETFEDTLRGLLEQTVIVYVDNVIDDTLEVTLYDTEGSKLTIVSPDENAYDTVEVLCPPLILRSTLTGYVSHTDECSVYIQPTEYADLIANLLDQMFESYDGHEQDLPIIPEEGLIYAVHSEDGNWYRGKVISFDDERAAVSYVDYGNSENVNFSELRELNDAFMEVCILCVQVNVTGSTDNLIDKAVIADITYGEDGWEGTVQLVTPSETSATESAEIERGEAAGMAVSEPVEEFTEQEIIKKTVEEQETAVNINHTSEEVVHDPKESVAVKGIQVTVSHADSPNEFYLQHSELKDAIEQLQSNLQEQVLEMAILETPAAGVLCAAPYSGDQQWYRAEVLDADDDITTVRFIDYGNTDVIDNKTTQIKTLPPNLLSLAVYASRCSLKVKPIDDEWNSNALEMFESLVRAETLRVEYVDQDEKTNYVELYCDDENIKDLLIKENLALPMELSIESKSTCFVSHLNSPSEFWIQLENCVDELEWIAEQLSGSENFPELEDLTPGTLCAALFPDDEMWYRARILSNTVAGIELVFIDYGSCCMSNSLRQLPEDLVATPPLAQKCSLQKPEGIPYWTPQAIAKFNEISAEGQTIFTVRKISTGETSMVQLLIDGEDVTSMLLPTTEDGYVKNIESLESFNIEKNGETLPENQMLEPMPGMTWTEESQKRFKELAKQGTTLFQIEFISQNVVRLYLDGNDIRPNLQAVKRVSLNLSKIDADKENPDYEIDRTVVRDTTASDVLENSEILIEKDVDKETVEFTVGDDASFKNTSCDTSPELTSDSQIHGIKSNDVDNPKSDLSPVIENINEYSPELNKALLQNDNIEKALDNLDVQNDSGSTRSLVSEEQKLGNDNPSDALLSTSKRDLSLAHKQIEEENISESVEHSTDTNTDVASLLHEEIEKALDKINSETSRPSSSCSGKIKHDDRILPAVVSRPHTPTKENIFESVGHSSDTNADISSLLHDEIEKALDKINSETSRPSSSCSGKIRHDDRILPAVVSRPHTPTKENIFESVGNSSDTNADIASLLHDETEKALDKINSETSRPSSSCSEKVKHDERILPAVVSRPHTPTKDESKNCELEHIEVKENTVINSRPESACSGKINFDEIIVPAALSRSESPLSVSNENESQKDKDIK